MKLRSGVSLLAVFAVLGGAAFYSMGRSSGVEQPEAEAMAPAISAVSTVSQVADTLNGLAPAAGQEAKEAKPEETAAESTEEKTDAPVEDTAPKKSMEEILKTQDLQLTYGKPEAPVTVIEYFSLSCPHCGAFYKESTPKLMKDYVDTGKVFYIMRYFPHNAPGLAATMLMQCVDEEKREQFLAALFNTQDKWAFTNDYKKNLGSIAQIGGIGPMDFDKCLADKATEDRVLGQRKEAIDGLKLEGIPTLFINGKAMEGSSYSRLTQTIEQELKASE